jgi:hypothetical protein
MGKVKNSKKYRKQLAERSQLVPLASFDSPHLSSNGHQTDTKTLVADIASLDVNRRERACVILGTILANYSSNFGYFDRLCSSDLLGKLCLRLVDGSHTVRLHAAGAVRNMTSSKFPVIAKRMVDAGIVSTMIALVVETLAAPLNESSASYAEQLVTAISNLWSISSPSPPLMPLAYLSSLLSSACEQAVTEVLQRRFLDVLFSIVCHDPAPLLSSLLLTVTIPSPPLDPIE